MEERTLKVGYKLCSVCGIHQTKKVSGICSRCERISPMHWKQCVICGERKTKDPTGVCSACRKHRQWNRRNDDNVSEGTRLDDAILVAERSLRLLLLRKQGASFSEIGRELGIAKGRAYAIYTRMIGSPMLSIRDIDGELLDVSDYRKSTANPPRLLNTIESDI